MGEVKKKKKKASCRLTSACPAEKGSFVTADRASRGGQEGDLSAGTRDGSGRERWETRIWSEKTVLPALGTTREAVVGERIQQSLFSETIAPVCLLGTRKDNLSVRLHGDSTTAEAGGLQRGTRPAL